MPSACTYNCYTGDFGSHIAFGMDALLGLGEASLAAANAPLLADVLGLLAACAGASGGARLTSTDLTRVVQVVRARVAPSRPVGCSVSPCALLLGLSRSSQGSAEE